MGKVKSRDKKTAASGMRQFFTYLKHIIGHIFRFPFVFRIGLLVGIIGIAREHRRKLGLIYLAAFTTF